MDKCKWPHGVGDMRGLLSTNVQSRTDREGRVINIHSGRNEVAPCILSRKKRAPRLGGPGPVEAEPE